MKLRLLKTGLFLAIVANLVACKQESIRGELVKSKGASAIWILDKDGNSVDMGEGPAQIEIDPNALWGHPTLNITSQRGQWSVELPDKVFENENFFSATAYEMNQGVDIEGRRREVILEEVEVEKRDSCKSAGFCRRTNFEGKVVTGFHSNCPGKKDVLYLRTDFKEVFEIKISLPKLSGGKELGVFTGEASPKVRYKEIKDLTACR